MAITDVPGLSPVQLRDAMAVAICRMLVRGEEVPEWAVRDFAENDSDARHSPTFHAH